MAKKETTAVEALARIKEAEARAKTIVEETRTRVIPALVEAARAEARKTADTIISQAKEMAEASKQAIIKQAREEAESIHQETQRELEKIERIARENFALAYKTIREQILQELKKLKE